MSLADYQCDDCTGFYTDTDDGCSSCVNKKINDTFARFQCGDRVHITVKVTGNESGMGAYHGLSGVVDSIDWYDPVFTYRVELDEPVGDEVYCRWDRDAAWFHVDDLELEEDLAQAEREAIASIKATMQRG